MGDVDRGSAEQKRNITNVQMEKREGTVETSWSFEIIKWEIMMKRKQEQNIRELFFFPNLIFPLLQLHMSHLPDDDESTHQQEDGTCAVLMKQSEDSIRQEEQSCVMKGFCACESWKSKITRKITNWRWLRLPYPSSTNARYFEKRSSLLRN